MNDPILAPCRRQSWTTFRFVDRVITLLNEGLPRSEAAECFASLGVSNTRITELLNGGERKGV